MKILSYFIILSILFYSLSSKTLFAQETILSGFILDQTKTRLGREFYEVFSQRWEFIPGLENFNLIINEISDPRWGAQIQIFVEDNLVFITSLKPRLEDIELKVEEAIDVLLQYFISLQEREKNIQEEKKFF